MVLEGEESPEQLRINVCSPNGTTLKAVDVLMEKDFRGIVEEAFDAGKFTTMNNSDYLLIEFYPDDDFTNYGGIIDC